MIVLNAALLRENLPRAPQTVIDAFIARQHVLQAAGICDTAARLAYLFANIDHECAGFSIAKLTENINYTPARMAQVWPNRFANAQVVIAKYGSDAGWQRRAFDEIYGGRMGNRAGTRDGSTYIGRGGPQITGRDGYTEIGARIGADLLGNPEQASAHHWQPDIAAAFWAWKNLARYADAGDFTGCVRAWNGGLNGLTDRQKLLRKWQVAFAAADHIAPAISTPRETIPVPTPTTSFFKQAIAAIAAAFFGRAR